MQITVPCILGWLFKPCEKPFGLSVNCARFSIDPMAKGFLLVGENRRAINVRIDWPSNALQGRQFLQAGKTPDPAFYFCINVRGDCFATIFNNKTDVDSTNAVVQPPNEIAIGDDRFDLYPRPLIRREQFVLQPVGLDSGPSSLYGRVRRILSFCNHVGGVISGSPGMVKCPPNEDQAHNGRYYRADRCPKHSFCPNSHVLLGLQIICVLFILPITFGLVFLGYQIANSGFDASDRGQKLRGFWAFCVGVCVAVASAVLLPWFGYWLAFEGGLAGILG